MRTFLKRFAIALALVLLIAQLVPVRHDNPPSDPAKSFYRLEPVPLEVHTALQRSCNDCHSNDTVWPWYSYVAPGSWIVAHDVHQARGKLNFSEWGNYDARRRDHKLEEICNETVGGDMPDGKYTLIHRDSKLSDPEREAICAWTNSPRDNSQKSSTK